MKFNAVHELKTEITSRKAVPATQSGKSEFLGKSHILYSLEKN